MPDIPTTGASPAPLGCPAGGAGVPADAIVGDSVDVDGDALADQEWLPAADGTVTFGITTATGNTTTIEIDLAGGGGRSALVADYDGLGDILAFVSDGRTADLLAYSGCTLIPILNVQGAPYQFDLGFRGIGTGAGCIDATDDGEPDLVGLNLQLDADGQPVQIDRTVIELDGPQATNGATGAIVTSDPAVADLARQISCGQLTMSGDGISLPG